MDAIKVLQIGGKDKEDLVKDTYILEWHYMNKEQLVVQEHYDVVFIEDQLDDQILDLIDPYVDAYHVFMNDHYKLYYKNHDFSKRKCAQFYRDAELPQIIKKLPVHYFNGQEGYAVDLEEIHISYQGSVCIEGKSSLVLSGNFHNEEVISLRRGFPIKKDQPMEVWIEYEKSKEIKLSVKAYEILEGSVAHIVKKWDFDQHDLKKALYFTSSYNGSINLMIYAEGSGQIKIGDIHIRRSRQGAGAFLVGGHLHHDRFREEFMSYFDPGNLKPPLNVYFSGYRTAEGFEGYYMMKSLKHPFLLIGDPRLEGGRFYMGSDYYEEKILKVINNALEICGFDHTQLILSGLSMGSFGALYYSAQLSPHSVIVGKPLVNIGSVASNETLFRPGGFPTSFDVLKGYAHALSKQAVNALDQKFWQVFDEAPFHGTKFVISYMKQDDYDRHAFTELCSHTQGKDVMIYGKGIEGRHNDNTSAIVKWFVSQYKYILKEDFEEGVKHG